MTKKYNYVKYGSDGLKYLEVGERIIDKKCGEIEAVENLTGEINSTIDSHCKACVFREKSPLQCLEYSCFFFAREDRKQIYFKEV